MNPSVGWEFVAAGLDGQPIVINGIDVWKCKWVDTKERVIVTDPHHNQEFTFSIFEIQNKDQTFRFAAGEFSNCVWGFYLLK
jgi:hypothetical protein